jgi:hypothetical protein
MTEKLPAPTPLEIKESKSIRFEVENARGGLLKYLISRSEPDEKFPEFRYFLNNLNEGFSYVGIIDPETGRLALTQGSKFSPDSPVYRVGKFALSVIWGHRELESGSGEIRRTVPKKRKVLPKLGRENEPPLPL